MKKIVLLFVLVTSINLSAQQVVEKIFDFSFRDYARDMTKLEDGNLLILASKGHPYNSRQLYMKLNENGDTISVVETDYYYAHGIVQIDSFYYETGYYGVPGGAIIMRDTEFNPILIREFGEMHGAVYSLGRPFKTMNNNLILSMSYYHPYSDIAFQYIKVFNSSNLNNIWRTSSVDMVYSFVELTDGNILSSGYDVSNNDTKIDLSLYDSVGNQLYISNFGNWDFGFKSQIQTLVFEDNAFLMCRENIYNLDENHLQLYKVDIESGLPQWSKSYFHNYNAKISTSCNGFGNNMIVAGTCIKDSVGAVFIFTFNSLGDSISTIFIDDFYKLVPYKIISNDESFYLTGYIEYEDYSSDIYFLKAPLDTTYISTVSSLEQNYNFNISPNPANNVIWLTTNSENAKVMQLSAISINGLNVFHKDLISGVRKHKIDISIWPQGVYVLSLYDNGELLQTKKVVVLK